MDDRLTEDEAGAIADLLDEIDRESRGRADRTEGPDEGEDPDRLLTEGNEEEDEAGDPQDEEDTAGGFSASAAGSAAFQASLSALTSQLNAKAKGKGGFTAAQVAQMLLQFRSKKPAKKTTKIIVPPAPAKPPPKPAVVKARKEAVDQYKKYVGKSSPVIVERGYYYATGEFVLKGEEDEKRAYLVAQAAEAKMNFFHEAIDEDGTRLGNVHRVSAADTNLRNPGRNSYPDQIFLIEEIEAEYRGIRVKYSDAAIDLAVKNTTVKEALKGNSMIWDDAGLVLPKQLFRDNDGVCELERALHGSGVLRFVRTRHDAGDNSDARSILIDTFRHIPVHGRRASIADTSGAATSLMRYGMKEVFPWSLDPNNPDVGQFRAVVELLEDFVFPIERVDLGNGMEVTPEKVGVYWELRLHGTSIRKRNSTMIALNKRK